MKKLFEDQCRRTPDLPALQCGEQILTFTQLNRRANYLARDILKKVGSSNKAPVGISCMRSFDSVVAVIAMVKAGIPYVPIDPEYPENRKQLIIEDSGVKHIITNVLSTLSPPLISPRRLKASSSGNLRRSNPTNSTVRYHEVESYEWVQNPEDVETDELCILYTSGSTGKPKGVQVNQHATLNRFRWMWERYPFEDDDIASHRSSLNFVDALWEMWGPLLQGIQLVIIPFAANGDLRTTVGILKANYVTRFTTVPILLESILMTFPNLGEALPDMRLWIVSGETLTSNLASAFLAADPRGVLLNLYGSTEVAGDVTYHEITSKPQGPVPIGRAISNASLYVMDDTLTPLPMGVTGELYVGGPVLATGYLNNPEQTAVRFKHTEHGLLFKTGDLVYQGVDGLYYFVNRTGNRVKVRGMQVELNEVNHTLERFAPNVKAVVVSYEGKFTTHLVAFMTPANLDLETVQIFAEEEMPNHYLPASYHFLDEFPLLPNGKVDVITLAARAKEYHESTERVLAPEESLQSIAEFEVARIWSEILEIRVIGRNDNFFDLGADSMNLAQFIAISQSNGYTLTFADLISDATLHVIASKYHFVPQINHVKSEFKHITFVEIAPWNEASALDLITTCFVTREPTSVHLKISFEEFHKYTCYSKEVSTILLAMDGHNIVAFTVLTDFIPCKADQNAYAVMEPVWGLLGDLDEAYITRVLHGAPVEQGQILNISMSGMSPDVTRKEGLWAMMMLERNAIALARERNYKRVITTCTNAYTSFAAKFELGMTLQASCTYSEYTWRGEKPFSSMNADHKAAELFELIL